MEEGITQLAGKQGSIQMCAQGAWPRGKWGCGVSPPRGRGAFSQGLCPSYQRTGLVGGQFYVHCTWAGGLGAGSDVLSSL